MAKQKHNIAHGIIEFTSEGLRQVKKEFKELEKEIKGFKSGDVIDRNKAMAALRLIDQTSAAYKELEKALQGVGDKIKVNADLQKHLADPTLNKVLKTYLAMGPALRSAGKELQVVARLQKNLSTTVAGTGGGGLSYRYMQGVPGRANSIKERQLDRGRLDDNLTESLKARVEEIKQVFSTKGGNVVASRFDIGKEIAIAVDDEFKRTVQARREQASFATSGMRKMALQGQLDNGKIGEDEFYSQMVQLNARDRLIGNIAGSAIGAGSGSLTATDFQDVARSAKVAIDAEFGDLETPQKLRAFSNSALQIAEAIRQKTLEIKNASFTRSLNELHQKLVGKKMSEADYEKKVTALTEKQSLKDSISNTYESANAAKKAARDRLAAIAAEPDPAGYMFAAGSPERVTGIAGRAAEELGRENLKERLSRRYKEIDQTLQGPEHHETRWKERARAAMEESQEEYVRSIEEISQTIYGSRIAQIGMNLDKNRIDKDQAYDQMRKVEQDKDFDMSMANSAISRGRSRGYYADFDPAMSAGSVSKQIDSQHLNESAKLRAFSEAAVDMANAIRMKVTELRTVHLDRELEDLFRKMENKSIDPYEFQKGAENVINKKQASSAVFPLLQKIQAPEDVVDEDLSKAQMQQKEFEEGLKSLTDLSGGLTEEQEKLVKTSRDMLQTNVDNAKAAVPLKERMNEIKSQTSALAAKRARGVKLTKDEIKITERLGAEYSALQSKVRVLTAGVNGHNVALHEGAVSSRRYNYMLQQASYGVQDFVQVIGQTGLSGALRASANNIAAVFGAMGNTGGALAGAGITFLMIGIAESAKSLGLESETAAEKLEKLNSRIESFVKARAQMTSGRLELISEKGITSGRSVSDSMSSGLAVEESRRKYEEAVDAALSDFIGGGMESIWDTLEGAFFTEPANSGFFDYGGQQSIKGLELTKQMQVENVAAAKLRGGKNTGNATGNDGIVMRADALVDSLDKAKMTKADKALAEILNADADTLEGRIKILEILIEQGDISENMKKTVSDAKKSMSDALVELRNMTILSGEESLKIRQNIKKMEAANLPKVASGDLSVFEILREAQESAIEKIKQYNKLLADKTLPDDVRKNYETQRANVGAVKKAAEDAQARLEANYVAPSRSAQVKDIMSSVGDITASKASPFEKSQRLREFSQDFNESSKDFGAGRRFGKTKAQSITDTQNEMNAYKNSLTDPVARQAVDLATIRLIESMQNSRDEFEELAHQTDQFIKRAKESDIFTVDMKEAVSGAREFAEQTKPLLEEITKLQQDLLNTTDPDSRIEIGQQIASKQATVDKYKQAAQAKLISAVSSGPNGILGGILQGVEDASVDRNSLIKGGAAPADADAAAKGVIDQHIYDAIQGFSGKFAVKPGETQEEARMRFAQEADAADVIARQKEATGELPAGTADAIKQAAILAIDKSQNQRQQVGLTSAENMWSSIQTSLSSPENYDKKQWEAASEIVKNTADIVTALKNGFTL
jgi:hypothetical protein